MPSYTFDSENILRSGIRGKDRSLQYRTNTVKHYFSRDHTTIEDASGHTRGTINWQERRSFQISERRNEIPSLKRKLSTFSWTRYWKRTEGEEYQVKYSSVENTWTVKTSTGETIGELHSRVERLFKANSTPTLFIGGDIRDEDEQLFILMVLLYSETRRLDRDN
ncbi:hypothetical protein B0H11DRAFT_340636 [Mycena galericulata]|nr:hypothetical protein B0H11DRAFT_340636 [Mycena galericulata]